MQDDAARIHAEALVCDMCLPWRFLPRSELATSLDLKWDTLRRLAAAGVGFASLTIATDEETAEDAARAIAQECQRLRGFADRYELVRSVADIRRARQQGRLALSFNFQGTAPIGRELGLIEVFYDLGVRHLLLAYNQRNWVGNGCHEISDDGLSVFGRRFVEECNAVGMLVDLSHTGYRTCRDAIEVSSKPVIFSHSNARALCDHPRNVPDDLLKACAASGGVIGINGIGAFLGGDSLVELLLDQVDYVSELVGVEHVGLGIDYMYDLDTVNHRAELFSDAYPAGQYAPIPTIKMLPPEDYPGITAGLLARGYGSREIRGVLGENFLRVCETVWRTE